MIKFWNGNKSAARQSYEYQLLQCLVEGSQLADGIENDLTDYPLAVDEREVLDKGTDLLVTVAGNKKFSGKPLIELKHPLCNGLLGWRLCIVADHRVKEFQSLSLSQLRQKKVGVPATWVDAEVFRANGFTVIEQGSLDDMLNWVADGSVDFITLGANEAHDILQQQRHLSAKLAIEPTLAVYYPFPLVFYLNHNREDLANLLVQQLLKKENQMTQLFEQHYGRVVGQSNLHARTKIVLDNPLLPREYLPLLERYEQRYCSCASEEC
ncbi:hypothetical protein [Vibrio sp. M260112]|uniref:hypothetical protein n=1 Tax=Vibrio sp. M260112 TaxID=3020895 RepID=UPI002F4201D0